MSFRDIRDQDVAVKLLRNMLVRNRIPNGLLFWGPGGIGKRRTAIEMAKALDCAQANGDACDACLPCRKITSGNHPDVAYINPVKKSRIIDVETIQSMNELASLRPFEAKWRVFIIQDAERMGLPAQNHFLKTLEEPPGNSLFILLTEFPGALLPTIRSRCQRVRFGTLRPETVSSLLREHRDISPEIALSIAGLAQGQMSRALDFVDSDKRDVALSIMHRLRDGVDPIDLAEEFSSFLNAKRKQIEAAVKSDTDAADADVSREGKEELKKQQLALAEALIRRDIMDFVYLFETWCRDEEIYRALGESSHILNRDQLDELKQAKGADLERRLAALDKARVYLERFLNEERVFRDLFFALAQ